MKCLISIIFIMLLSACAASGQKTTSMQTMPITDVQQKSASSAPQHESAAVPMPKKDATDKLAKKALPADYRKALGLMMQKKWSEAESLLLKFAEDRALGEAVYANLAILAVEREQWTQALQWVDKAMVIKETAELFNIRGVALRQLGQFAEAVKAYEQAISLAPQQARYYYNLGILYDIYLQDLDKARENYKQYLALNSDNDKIVRGWMQDLQHRAQASN